MLQKVDVAKASYSKSWCGKSKLLKKLYAMQSNFFKNQCGKKINAINFNNSLLSKPFPKKSLPGMEIILRLELERFSYGLKCPCWNSICLRCPFNSAFSMLLIEDPRSVRLHNVENFLWTSSNLRDKSNFSEIFWPTKSMIIRFSSKYSDNAFSRPSNFTVLLVTLASNSARLISYFKWSETKDFEISLKN